MAHNELEAVMMPGEIETVMPIKLIRVQDL